MNPTVIVLGVLSIIEFIFTGFGLTSIFYLISRIGYSLNTFGFNFKCKTCLIWEGISFGWVLLKVLLFKSVHFNLKYTVILFILGGISVLVELYDSITYCYIKKDIEDKKE